MLWIPTGQIHKVLRNQALGRMDARNSATSLGLAKSFRTPFTTRSLGAWRPIQRVLHCRNNPHESEATRAGVMRAFRRKLSRLVTALTWA